MKNTYLKFCDLVAKACGAFAVLALLISILVIVELVFERYFFQRAITWQTELVTMLLVASTFIGSAYVLSEKAHVSMEWIYDFLSKKNIVRLKIFTSILSLMFFLILLDRGFFMKKKYLKFCDLVAKACGAFAVLALLLSILVIVELVFERYFFQRAITWQTELVTMLLVASTFIGSAYVLSEKAHVSMEWIYDFLSKKNILRLKIFTSLVSLLFFLILFYFGFLMVEEAFTKNYSTGTVWDPPLWIPYSSMMIGAGLMILQYIAEIIKLTDEKDIN